MWLLGKIVLFILMFLSNHTILEIIQYSFTCVIGQCILFSKKAYGAQIGVIGRTIIGIMLRLVRGTIDKVFREIQLLGRSLSLTISSRGTRHLYRKTCLIGAHSTIAGCTYSMMIVFLGKSFHQQRFINAKTHSIGTFAHDKKVMKRSCSLEFRRMMPERNGKRRHFRECFLISMKSLNSSKKRWKS
jgi:hypothetical protein